MSVIPFPHTTPRAARATTGLARLISQFRTSLTGPAPRPRRPARPPLPHALQRAEPWLLDDLGLPTGEVNARPATIAGRLCPERD